MRLRHGRLPAQAAQYVRLQRLPLAHEARLEGVDAETVAVGRGAAGGGCQVRYSGVRYGTMVSGTVVVTKLGPRDHCGRREAPGVFNKHSKSMLDKGVVS